MYCFVDFVVIHCCILTVIEANRNKSFVVCNFHTLIIHQLKCYVQKKFLSADIINIINRLVRCLLEQTIGGVIFKIIIPPI